ncbi:MAG: autotransporter outer membrane beta-barrel domain-containing protein, partial [Phascolarctobacterium sp.]|nr:autotransporter outer membrane beta-barrel domain-containing protein [Candidatus Phascolarctobacterium equi]
GWTIDGAVRAGRVETSWGNNDKGGYEAKQTYYGAHVTFNKMLKEYGEQKLNGYLRYTITHLGSDSVNLDGTHYGFDSVNSHRTRLGARMVEEGQNGFELYYGAAWEYGFGGDCDATVNGVTTSGPAVDGSNAVFEVGGTWSDKKWDISAGLEGYASAKRGVAGGMNFVYKF